MAKSKRKKKTNKTLSSTAKGDSLERTLFTLIESRLTDFFPVDPTLCQIYHRKGYYSKDRGSNIIFDLSIEVKRKDSEKIFYIILIECKNYNHAVPVDDAEEFFQKIQQISGGNVKGIIASTNNFQQGTIRFSESKGLGLLRYCNSSQYEWVLERAPIAANKSSKDWQIYQYLTSPTIQNNTSEFYGLNNSNLTDSIQKFFFSLIPLDDIFREFGSISKQIDYHLNIDKTLQNAYKVDYISTDEIEKTTEKILKSINYSHSVVDLLRICNYLTQEHGLKLNMNADPSDLELTKGLLGKISFRPLKITIFKSSDSRSHFRQRFTLAHELGHYFLGHSKYISSELTEESNLKIIENSKYIHKDIARLEWQANYFASCLLLPKRHLIHDFIRIVNELDIKDKGYGLMYIDSQSCNLENYFKTTNHLMFKYGASRTAIRIRLENLNLLNYAIRKQLDLSNQKLLNLKNIILN